MDHRRTVLLALVAVGLVAGGLLGVGLVAVDTASSDASDATDTSDAGAVPSAGIDPAAPRVDGVDGNVGNDGVAERSCPERATGAADSAVATSGNSDRDAVVSDGDGGARIVELYPNPTIRDNVGEYLVLEAPPGTRLANWSVTDGHTTARLPNETVTGSGRVALSTAPNVTAGLTDERVLGLEGTLRLAVDGDELELRNGTATVDTVAYDRAPLADRWYRSESGETDRSRSVARGDWHPRGATCLPVSTAAVDDATAFVLPDSPAVPLETIRDAEDRLLLAGYTLTSEAVTDELLAATERGVDVAVLFEGGPVGGTPRETDSVLERLERADVDVRVVGGEGARYRYHHAKYAVADDRVLVTTENWKPSGVGGAASRGWGVRLEDAGLAADLARVFRADHGGWDTASGAAFRANASYVDDDGPESSPETLTADRDPATVPLESAELLVAPDNAESRLIALLDGADEEILVKQASIDRDAAVLEATIDAARRGVSVRILLDATWYHEDENAALARDLEDLAAAESLPLEVRLVEERDAFEKIHAKGVVIDREVAVVGSANWNGNAFRNNREVLLALHGEAIAGYYADVFEADWDGEGGSRTLTVGTVLAVVAALAVAALVGRRYVRFGDPP